MGGILMGINDQLIKRFPAPEWAIFFEVANGLGAHHRRYADAVAMSLFPSRGLDVHGFEVKSDRGDWLRELKEPGKADVIAQYCDFWWLVTTNEKIAPKDEVPKTWGLLVSKDGELRQVKKAERMKPKTIDRSFMGAMLRRAHQWTECQLRDDERVRAAREEGRKAGLEERDYSKDENKDALERLQKRLKDFQESSGINIDNWHAGSIGEAVKAFMGYRNQGNVHEEMERVAGWIEETAKGLREKAALVKMAQEKAEANVPG